MRHHNSVRKFGRKTNVRRALMRGLIVSLVEHESITTTEAKAKELRPMIEKLITKAMNDSVANRRLIAARVNNNDAVIKKLFTDIAPRYQGRNGGYTRVLKLPQRLGDGAAMAIIQFV